MKHARPLLAAWVASRLFLGCHAVTDTPSASPRGGTPVDGGGPAVVDDASAPLSISAPRIFLGDVAIEKHSAGRLDGKSRFKLVTHARPGSPALRELSRRGVRYTQRADGGELLFHGYPQAHDRPTRRDRTASFLVDYDSSEVDEVREQIGRDLGKHPSMTALAEFVDRYVVTKDLLRQYDPASVVARRREGDCSEHAVLLAALGRAFGFATRVVHGIVILDSGEHIEAEGHAWVEWANVSGWLPADAAVPARLGPIYVPLQLLNDESPAYGRQLLLSMPGELGPIVIETP